MKGYSKYKAKKHTLDGITFDSQLESRIYKEIKELGWNILELQPMFILMDKFRHDGKAVRAITYKADFLIEKDGDKFYVDAKGMKTPVFSLKHKLWLNRFGDENILLLVKSKKDLREQLSNL